jgi:Uma2 family endonuclease
MSLAYLEHYSVRDYELWNGDWELIGGAPYAMSPSPSISHQRLEKQLIVLLDEQLKTCDGCEVLSELDWYCSDDTVVRPDLLIACNVTGEKLTLTPEVIIEIVSPGSAKRDELIKFDLFQKEGVNIYLLIYPDTQKAKIFRLVDGAYVKAGDYHDGSFDFVTGGCSITLDFGCLSW